MYKNSIARCYEHGVNDLKAPSPVVISGSTIHKGEGTMLTLVTGKDSEQGKINQIIQEDKD